MEVRIVAFTQTGALLAVRLGEKLTEYGHGCGVWSIRPLEGAPKVKPLEGSLADWVKRGFVQGGGVVFVGACGIAVRSIAPYLESKTTDPAVVVVDEGGRFAIALLSGHTGGANDLAREVAQGLGGTAVITTATDVEGLFAVDEWARKKGWKLENPERVKSVSGALLAGNPVVLHSDFPVRGTLPRGMTLGEKGADIWITLSQKPGGKALKIIPPILTVGVGCRKGIPEAEIALGVAAALKKGSYSPLGLCQVASIDLKAREPGILACCQGLGVPFRTFSAEELAAMPGSFTSSAFVQQVTGVDNVCERSAVLAAGGRLLVKKRAGNGVTAAVAAPELWVEFGEEMA